MALPLTSYLVIEVSILFRLQSVHEIFLDFFACFLRYLGLRLITVRQVGILFLLTSDLIGHWVVSEVMSRSVEGRQAVIADSLGIFSELEFGV